MALKANYSLHCQKYTMTLFMDGLNQKLIQEVWANCIRIFRTVVELCIHHSKQRERCPSSAGIMTVFPLLYVSVVLFNGTDQLMLYLFWSNSFHQTLPNSKIFWKWNIVILLFLLQSLTSSERKVFFFSLEWKWFGGWVGKASCNKHKQYFSILCYSPINEDKLHQRYISVLFVVFSNLYSLLNINIWFLIPCQRCWRSLCDGDRGVIWVSVCVPLLSGGIKDWNNIF